MVDKGIVFKDFSHALIAPETYAIARIRLFDSPEELRTEQHIPDTEWIYDSELFQICL